MKQNGPDFLIRTIAWSLICSSICWHQAQAYKSTPLADIARRTLAYYFETDRLRQGSISKLLPELQKTAGTALPAGVFVTLSDSGKTRACWGSLSPGHPDLVQSIVYATLGALTREYRFAQIRPDEWRRLKVQVTVIKGISPLDSLRRQNPLSDGLLVRSGGKSAVLLPGEAKDAYYQMVQCKLKAGIKPAEPCQLYRIKADVYQ